MMFFPLTAMLLMSESQCLSLSAREQMEEKLASLVVSLNQEKSRLDQMDAKRVKIVQSQRLCQEQAESLKKEIEKAQLRQEITQASEEDARSQMSELDQESRNAAGASLQKQFQRQRQDLRVAAKMAVNKLNQGRIATLSEQLSRKKTEVQALGVAVDQVDTARRRLIIQAQSISAQIRTLGDGLSRDSQRRRARRCNDINLVDNRAE